MNVTVDELQRRFPAAFVCCPACAELEPGSHCPACLGTGHCTRTTARRWFEDRGLAVSDFPLRSKIACVLCGGPHLRERCPQLAALDQLAEEGACMVCAIVAELDDDGFCSECAP